MSLQSDTAAPSIDPVHALQQFAPLITSYTNKFYSRAVGLDRSIDQDDIRQELSLITVRCARSFDPERGGSFMNFLINAWLHEMNRLFVKQQRNRETADTVSAHQDVGDGDESVDLFDYVESGHATPEESLEALSCIEHALSTMSEPALMLARVLLDPPQVVQDQLELQMAGALHRRTEGTDTRAPREVTFRFLLALLDIPKHLAYRVRREIHFKVEAAFGI